MLSFVPDVSLLELLFEALLQFCSKEQLGCSLDRPCLCVFHVVVVALSDKSAFSVVLLTLLPFLQNNLLLLLENTSCCFLVTLFKLQLSQLLCISIWVSMLKSRVRSYVVLAFSKGSVLSTNDGRICWIYVVFGFITVDIVHFSRPVGF